MRFGNNRIFIDQQEVGVAFAKDFNDFRDLCAPINDKSPKIYAHNL